MSDTVRLTVWSSLHPDHETTSAALVLDLFDNDSSASIVRFAHTKIEREAGSGNVLFSLFGTSTRRIHHFLAQAKDARDHPTDITPQVRCTSRQEPLACVCQEIGFLDFTLG